MSASEFDKLNQLIDGCMLVDRFRMRRRLATLRKQAGGKARSNAVSELAARIEQSRARVERRRDRLPQPQFPDALPISQRLDEISALVREHQVVILCGETGSGKSTQLPKLCLQLGRGVYGRIAHTQPRRIAARSLAARISSELGRETGDAVGYKVRFHDRVSEHTCIKLMTDGMLLAEVQQDRFLNEYDTIILDEAHERSLNIDFLLGYLKQLLPKRPELKLIVTSATIDPERFSSHFSSAPIIEVSGRTYPVEVRYQPPEEEGANERDDALQQAILDAVDELSRIERGDILIFLSGEREIRETAERLHKHRLQLTEILPLYARMGSAEQSHIFKPSGLRRIILATNVAETSLTVPGIKYVIDTGFARISRYSHRSKIQRLPVERISQASADQRKGRCGRVSEGICIRLYTEEDYQARREFTEAEILRTNLASVILQMKVLGFGNIERFPFVDAPDSRLIKDGYRILEEIGAVDGTRKVTRLGRKLARLPLDPRISRMLLEAAHTTCLSEVLVIAAALSVQDPRDRPVDKRQEADEAHALFRDEESDFMGFLKLWDYLEEKRRHLTRRKFQRLCRQHFLSSTRVQEWHDIHRQIRAQMHDMGYRDNKEPGDYELIHRAILSGLLSHIGFRPGSKDKGYQGARNTRFHIFPGSGLFEGAPKWVMAAELVETTKLYARTVARIQPEWVESLAGHLVKRHYSEPHWQSRKGQVGGYEKVTLFGITLVPRRRINYGVVDPVEAREIFLRFALTEGDFHTRAPFWRHNRELIQSVHDMEARSRRRDILVDEEKIYQFYDQRLPEAVYNRPLFERWHKGLDKTQARILYMEPVHVMRDPDQQVSDTLFPDHLVINGMQLPLEYHFEPGHAADGVTLVVPAAVLNQVGDQHADWIVPGLLQEKLVALIKGLPKQVRKQFVPAPDFARRCSEIMVPGEQPLLSALGLALKQLTGAHVSENDWDPGNLTPHLIMRFRVINGEGKTLAASRNLAALQQQYAGSGSLAPDLSASRELRQDGLKQWDFEALPETVETNSSGIRLTGYPALVDQGESVSVRVMDSARTAESAHRLGLRRLFMLVLSKEVRYLRKNMPDLRQMRLQYAKAAAPVMPPTGETAVDLEDELLALIVDRTFVHQLPEIRDKAAFEARVAERKGSLVTIANETVSLVADLLDKYQQVRKRLAETNQINWLKSINDVRQQLDSLVYRGFLHNTEYAILEQYPRYLQAIVLRLDKLQHAASRDQQRMQEMAGLQEELLQRCQALRNQGREDPRLEEIGWMLQELRVSLFAQELKTRYPVSVKRIQKRWRELGL